MSEQAIAMQAESLGISTTEPTEESLRGAILSELMTLQVGELTPEQAERRRLLTDALVQLRNGEVEKKPSSELVPISATGLAEIVRAAVTAQHLGPSPEEKMRTGVLVAATQARKDFRNARALPLAGFGAIVAFVWSQRAALGVDLSSGGLLVWSAGALAILSMALTVFMIAHRAQRDDEWRLRRLYSPDVQVLALRRTMNEPVFTLDGYRVALEQASLPFLHRPSARLLSTVDIESAVDDASMLALERFVKLGVIEPVESITGAEYRLTVKYRAEHPVVGQEGEAPDPSETR